MVDAIIDWLSLEAHESAVVVLCAVLVLYAFDLIAAIDGVPGNTPREWVLRLAGWSGAGRPVSRTQGRTWLRWVPVTGAVVPFMLGVLLGHFFHPAGWRPALGESLASGLGWVALMALVVGATTRWWAGRGSRLGPRGGTALVLWGVIAGAVLWPVGA